jgi:uncharacterized protein (TIGR03437 family)
MGFCRFLLFFAALVLPAAAQADPPWPTVAWTVSTPEQQGIDSARLEAASKYVEQSCPARYSLLVVRHGRIVLERYYHGSRMADANNICSISKSILSVLVGIAFAEGRLRDLDQPLAEFFPALNSAGSDARKRSIRLRDAFTMTAGLKWQEVDAVGGDGEDLPNCLATRDWAGCVLGLPMVTEPASTFNYSTGLTHVVSTLLTKVTGQPMRAYAEPRLFAPLGMECPRWAADPQGNSAGGFNIWLTVRDLARFGLLVMNNGRWDGREIVPAAWIDASTRLRVRTGSAGWGFGDYGYFWWKKTIGGYPLTLASGYGGQNIFIVPELDLLVVTTSRSDLEPPFSAYQQPYTLMSDYILPAVQAPLPALRAAAVAQSADGSQPLAAGAFATAAGTGLALVERDWSYAMPADGRLPECIAGVCATIGNRVAHVRFASPERVEVLIPPDLAAGPYSLQIRTPQGTASADVTVQAVAPAWFGFERDARFIVNETPAYAGSALTLRASGLGAAVPAAAAGTVISTPRPLATQPRVFVDSQEVPVTNAVLAEAGIWQMTVQLPDKLPPGLLPIQICSGSACSRADAFIEIATGVAQ